MSRYLTPMLVIAISMGVYFLYIDETYKGIEQKLAHEQVIVQFIEDANDAKNLLDKVVAAHRSFPPDADERLGVLLPETVDPVRLIIDLDTVAIRHGLTVRSPTVMLGRADPEKPGSLIQHELSFSLVSTYSTFRRFLRDVESSLAVRDFTSVAFASQTPSGDAETKTETNPEFQVLKYDVRINTYSLR